jgi:uncharacterized protein (TIGR02453 family)
MEPAEFDGFPKDLFAFLRELARNNDRNWFNANKERYKSSVIAPMSSFISAMDGKLAKVSECFIADPRPNGGSMFRIYRDVRFSKDKRPYKEHVACHFRHIAGKDAHALGFYVHLEPNDVFFGGGIWHPPNPVLREIRTAIVEDPAAWKAATRSKAFRARFGEIRGEALKRPPQGFDADHPLVDDLKRKSFFAVQNVDAALALTKDFARQVQGAFVALKPMMSFLADAVGVTFDYDD